MASQFIQMQPVKLSGSGITSTATSIGVQSFKDPAGNNIVTADLGDQCYGTLEPNTAREEIISFTGVTQNGDGTATLTGVTRNLDYTTPYTQISATGYAHAGGTILVISNNPQVYNDACYVANDETVSGDWTFTGTPTFTSTEKAIYDSNPTFSDDKELITKKYADDLAIAGAPDSSATVKGLVEKATSAETQSGTDSGGTTAPLFAAPSDIAANVQNSQHTYAADAEASDTYVITLSPAPSAYSTGQVFWFKANTANTGAATLNVNSLGAKTIKKLHDQDLENNDIEANSILCVVYDGTNFQLQTPQATMPSTAILSEMSTFFSNTDMTGAEAEELTDGSTTTKHVHETRMAQGQASRAINTTGTQNIAHGLGVTPRMVWISCRCENSANELCESVGTATSTSNETCTHSALGSGTSTTIYTGQDNTHIINLDNNSSVEASATLSALDATNITINWDVNQNSGSARVFQWMAWI